MPANQTHPIFRISVDGADLPANVADEVREIVVSCHSERASSFSVRLAGENHMDGDMFPLGAKVEIFLGNDAAIEKVLEAEITSWYAELLPKGNFFIFRGHDKSHRLRAGSTFKSHVEKTDADATGAVVSAASLSADKDSTPGKWPVLEQLGTSNYQFLHDRALRLGYRMYGENGKLIFKKPTYEDSGIKFTFDNDIAVFDVLCEMSDMPTEVEARGWDVKKKETIVGTAKPGDEYWAPENANFGPKVSKKAFGDGKIILQDLGALTVDEAKTIAKGYFNRRAERFCYGPLTSWGNPKIKVGKVVKLEGMGDAMGGSYVVLGVTHFFGQDGYYSRMELSSNCL